MPVKITLCNEKIALTEKPFFNYSKMANNSLDTFIKAGPISISL